MPVHLTYGDSFLVSQALKELQRQVGPIEMLEANSHRFSGAQTNLNQLRTVCDALPFLAEKRLVLVEGLLTLFEPRDGRGRGVSDQDKGSSLTASWKGLEEYVATLSPTTLLVFTDGMLSRTNWLLRLLRPYAQVKELPTPNGESLALWIRNRAAEKGTQITPGAIHLLVQRIGGNLWALDNELEKLSLYVMDRPIEEKDIRTLVPQVREASIFAAVDALLDGRSGIALQLLHRLQRDGAQFPYIISMVARQLRLVILTQDLSEKGLGQEEISSRLKLFTEFSLKRTLEQARRHPRGDLVLLYQKLMGADLAVKQGRLDEDVALELLVSELASLR